jgi:hypothetical protein
MADIKSQRVAELSDFLTRVPVRMAVNRCETYEMADQRAIVAILAGGRGERLGGANPWVALGSAWGRCSIV